MSSILTGCPIFLCFSPIKLNIDNDHKLRQILFGSLFGVFVSNQSEETIINEFDTHWVPQNSSNLSNYAKPMITDTTNLRTVVECACIDIPTYQH